MAVQTYRTPGAMPLARANTGLLNSAKKAKKAKPKQRKAK